MKGLVLTIIALSGACGGRGGDSPAAPPVLQQPAPQLLNFAFRSQDNSELDSDLYLIINGAAVTGRLPTNSPVNGLVATFEFEGETVSIDGVTQNSADRPNDFTQPVALTVTNASGDIANYTVDVTNFTGLPIVYLATEGGVSIVSKEDYVPGTIRVDGWRLYDSIPEVTMEIRGRGHSTWFVHPKKPYQMKLSDSSEFLGMLDNRKWLFLAEYSDKTMLRNRLAFELGHLSNLDWTPDSRFAEVYLNGFHEGTYHISQKVEEGVDRVDLGDTGFLLEIDQPDHLDADDVYFETNEFLINIKEPDVAFNDEQYNLISSHINEFEAVLFGADFADPDGGYAAYIDVDSFVDWFLVNEIAKNVDAMSYSSIFLHYIPGQEIKMGPIWDFDLAFGNVDYADSRYSEGWWVRWNAWIDRLLADPVFADRVKQRFAYFRTQEPYLLSQIDQWSQMLNYSQAENDDIWGTLGSYVWPNPVVYDTYDEEVEHLKNWLQERLAWMETAVEQL
jgi:spore coat protein CotH